MFENNFESRLQQWSSFRNELETAEDPLQLAIDTYNQAPTVSINTDPYDQEIWPSPWELVSENQYCDFCKLLGICYSLQLTDRFSGTNPEIHIAIDDTKSESYYLLEFNKRVIGYDVQRHISTTDLPPTVQSQTTFSMPPLN